MTLNLNITNFGGSSAAQSLDNVQDAKVSKGNVQQDAGFKGLSVTNRIATSEDIAASAISDAELTRDDPLGNLVKSAFNLPPPAPPWL